MKGSLYVVGPGKYDIDLIFLIIHILLFPSTVNKIISSLSLQEKKKKKLCTFYFLKPMNLCCMHKDNKKDCRYNKGC